MQEITVIVKIAAFDDERLDKGDIKRDISDLIRQNLEYVQAYDVKVEVLRHLPPLDPPPDGGTEIGAALYTKWQNRALKVLRREV